ncbi:MAG TPA: sorbosone dehydrogenase family protein [Burkholderiaceae bacterium]|nr:sorbosone dehydrogenase family protein [Burkholderiaceae bacterium]
MKSRSLRICCGFASCITLLGCAESARLPTTAGVGPRPAIPEPTHSLLPTVNVAPAIGWAAGEAPKAAAGLAVAPFAKDLEHPRWLYVLPNGDVLVAESNTPGTEPSKGVRGWAMGKLMSRAGARVPSPDRIVLLRDVDGDGVAEKKTVFLQNLHSPFGMALIADQLYVANTDALWRYPYTAGAEEVTSAGVKVMDLPSGINHHWTKNLLASRDGTKLYVTVGSNSNAAENGMEIEDGRAAIWEVDLKTNTYKLFATGMRNPNGLDWNPDTGALWTVVNERDELGSDLVPDYLTSVHEGAFYGWPYSYFGGHVDARVEPQRPDLVAKAVVPDYALGTHVAALGLAFVPSVKTGTRAQPEAQLPARFARGAFIGEHGSWNRRPRSGYEVVFVPFEQGKPTGMPVDVLTGFVSDDGKARGRPVGVAIDMHGALLVADDVGNVVWRVTGSTAQAAR